MRTPAPEPETPKPEPAQAVPDVRNAIASLRAEFERWLDVSLESSRAFTQELLELVVGDLCTKWPAAYSGSDRRADRFARRATPRPRCRDRGRLRA